MRLKEIQFRFNLRRSLSQASEEELHITLEETRKELDKRRKKKKCQH